MPTLETSSSSLFDEGFTLRFIIKRNVREIQEIILAKEENLSTAMIGIDTLHLTLGVYYLEDGFRHFNHKVLYASLEENQGLEELNTLVNGVRTSLENDGVFTADDRYTPHVTISKMSKDMNRLRKLGVSRIDPSHYQEKRTAYFGQQVVKSIQLCAMNVPKTESGCKAALDRFHEQLRSENYVPLRLTVSRLGHFNDKVLFAALENNEGLEDLKRGGQHPSPPNIDPCMRPNRKQA
uniref:A-kinase anchor protein 7 isoform gamma n=1 Tax=Magallana gigas TaxID=29159 RepID=K1RAB7_MAGGI